MKKLSLLLTAIFCLLVTAYAYANTTYYNYALPVVGGSQNVWGTQLNTVFNSIDSNIWSAAGGTTIGVNSASSGSNIVLTNPIKNFQSITLSTTGKYLALPPMNATLSPVLGGNIFIYNAGTNSFQITAADGSTNVVTALGTGQSVQITPLSNSTTNGTFQVLGPYLTSVSGNVNLGTSTSSANPANSTAANTGLYTTSTSNVGVSILGTSVGLWNASGYNGAIGATTSSTALFATATISGGAINNTSIGATTSSTALFTTATVQTAEILGGAINATSIGATTSSTALFSTITVGSCSGCGSGFASQTNATSSRALSSVYHNTSGKTMFVLVTVTSDNASDDIGAYTDSNTSPSTQVGQAVITSGQTNCIAFMVLNGNYYKATAGSGDVLVSWYEWD